MIYYSAVTGGFYATEIHGDDIPAAAVEISDGDHAALLAGQAMGQRIVSGADGRPVLADPTVPTLTELAAQVRSRLNADSQMEMDAIAVDYPDYEIRTWPDQEREARAWMADNSAPMPTLALIAEERGLTMADLCARVIAKADLYRSVVARCVGLRRRLEDEVTAAEAAGDRVALEAIVWPGLS